MNVTDMMFTAGDGGPGDGIDYSKLVIHLKFDNTSPYVIFDSVSNPPKSWISESAPQRPQNAIVGYGSLNLINNSESGAYVYSTDVDVMNAMSFGNMNDYMIRFKYKADNWNAYYGAVLGSGPGNPVVTFFDNGKRMAVTGQSFYLNGGNAMSLNVVHEFLVTRKDHKIYFFSDGVLLNAGGSDDYADWPTQTEWRIGGQSHADEDFSGLLDDIQVFNGFGGPTASYTVDITTPFYP